MFKSIRWRLVLSYVLLTLLTVFVLGAITFSFVNEYVKNLETTFLTSNAEAIASQASLYLRPRYRPVELTELVDAASILGNVRVIIHNHNGELIADSGRPSGIDRFIWIHAPEDEVRRRFEGTSPFLLPILNDLDFSMMVD